MILHKMVVGGLYWVLLLLANHVGNSQSDYINTVVRRSVDHEGELHHNMHTRFVEVYVLYDHSYFRQFGSNYEAENYIIQAMNIANAVFRTLGIVVVMVGIESVNGRVRRANTIQDYIDNLKDYKKTFREKLDNIMLFTNLQFNEAGYAYTGGMCHPEQSASVVKASKGNTVSLTAQTVAHELGHNLGMGHDTESCVCPEEHCLMKESTMYSHNQEQLSLGWSNCSKNWMAQHFDDDKKFDCLKNVPEKVLSTSIRNQKSCGNGILEHGEQCDCGPERYCNNPCCNATTCNLNDHAHCASGVCCDIKTCRPKNIGTICRAGKNICDLPEYCSGHSGTCPPDVYKANGLHCYGQDRCYFGQCGAYNKQEWCQRLWGPFSKAAKDGCYRDRKCGVLQCRIEEQARREPNGDYRAKTDRNGCIFITERHIKDWKAPDGASCGQGKMCISDSCSPVPTIECPRNCSSRGVCNSKGHCHCDEGYAPPDCTLSGLGGSVDSGAIIDSTTLTPRVGLWIITALMIIFSIISLICCLGSRFKQWWARDGRVYVSSEYPCCATCIDSICYNLIIKMASCFDTCDPPNKEAIQKENIDSAKYGRKMTICKTDIEVNPPAPDLKSYGCADERLFTEVVTITPKGSPTTSRKIYIPADSPIIEAKEKISPDASPLPKRKPRPPLLKIRSKDSGCIADLPSPGTASTTLGSMGSLISIFKKFSSSKPQEDIEIRSNKERVLGQTRHSVEVMTSTPKKPVPLSRIVVERSHHNAQESPGSYIQDSPFVGGKINYKRSKSHEGVIENTVITPPPPPPPGLKHNNSADILNKINNTSEKNAFFKPQTPNKEFRGQLNIKGNNTENEITTRKPMTPSKDSLGQLNIRGNIIENEMTTRKPITPSKESRGKLNTRGNSIENEITRKPMTPSKETRGQLNIRGNIIENEMTTRKPITPSKESRGQLNTKGNSTQGGNVKEMLKRMESNNMN